MGSLNDLFTTSGAVFTPCKRYRYRLWRTWDDSKPSLVMVMLNPSIANEEQNDPTVERCQRRAMSLGYGGLVVTNIFALVSTDPTALYSTQDPVGPENDAAIRDAVSSAGMVLCAWGTHGVHVGRAKAVVDLLRDAGVTPYCLGQNADGSPKHPLYVRYAVTPMPYSL
ncbi:MAG: hypothetical protein FD131_3265 [Rhodocyclaceae bacterium]|nr:MAG: hypothetical protein FD131_3265 [Rhodocyclaceae bacterium]